MVLELGQIHTVAKYVKPLTSIGIFPFLVRWHISHIIKPALIKPFYQQFERPWIIVQQFNLAVLGFAVRYAGFLEKVGMIAEQVSMQRPVPSIFPNIDIDEWSREQSGW